MSRIFKQVHRKRFQEKPKKLELSEHQTRMGTKYDGAVSTILGHREVRGSRVVRKHPEEQAPPNADIA